MKLEIELYRYGSLVFGKVLQQSDDITLEDTGYMPLKLYSKDSFNIWSHNYPLLKENDFCIRGALKEYDNDLFSFKCNSVKKAKELCEKIKEGVDEINKNTKQSIMIEKII